MRAPDIDALLKTPRSARNCVGSRRARSVHQLGPMLRWSRLLTVFAVGALFGCGSSASLEFANSGPAYADAGDDAPYPDAVALDEEGGNKDAPTDAGEA